MPARAPPFDASAATKLAALGERIRERRKTLKVSAVDAAEAAGMTMGAYIGAATAVGLELELVDPRERRRGAGAAGGKPPFPARIRLADYPQLNKLAWQLHGVTTIAPAEALGLYERNWRHVDTAALDAAERALVNALVLHLGGGRLLV